MTDPIFDPTTNAGQGTNPPMQNTDQTHDIFGGSADIFDNPNMFTTVHDTPDTQKAPENISDFSFNFDNLQANDTEPVIIQPEPVIIQPEPVIIQPEPHIETSPEPKPEPIIIEQVIEPKKPLQAKPPQTKPAGIEPQIKPGVKVNPRKGRETDNVKPGSSYGASSKTVAPKSQPKPEVSIQNPVPRIQNPVPSIQKPGVVEPQIKTGIQVNPWKGRETLAPKPEIKPSADDRSDTKKKFDELVQIIQNIYTLEKKESDGDTSGLELLGADNDKITILYQFALEDGNIFIKKIETDKIENEETINDLGFVYNKEDKSVEIMLDEVLLFNEIEHLQDDQKKKMQVNEKFNKFIFLLGEYFKKAEKEVKEKEEAENERRRLQDIFRNF